jgi:hypothetical protein
MSNEFVSLPVPSGDGVGAWVDTSALAPAKTISVDGGPFGGTLYIEASNDAQASAFPADCGPFTGPTFSPQEFSEPCQYMRVRRAGSSGTVLGSPSVGVGGITTTVTTYAAMTVPTTDGIGAATDLTAGGDVNSFAVVGDLRGAQLFIETSTDGVNFSPTLLFTAGHAAAQTVRGVLNSARVRIRGATSAVTSLVSVGSGSSTSAGVVAGVNAVHAGTAISITGTAADPIVNNTGVTSAVAGAGISVSSATGAVTFTNTGVTSIIAGSNISISGSTGAVTINATGGGGGVSTVTAGTAISVTGTSTNPIVNNTGVTSAIAGTGISVSSATGGVTFNNTGVTSIVAGTNVTISGSTGAVTINATTSGVATVTAGTAISVTGTGTNPIINNTGVTSAIAGTGIGVSSATGGVTFTNTGVTSIIAGTNVTISGSTGAVTINATAGGGGVSTVSAGTAISITGTGSNPIVNNIGVTSNVAGAGISVSSATGAVTVTNTGVTSIVAGTGITISGSTGAVTVNATATSFPGFGGPPPAIAAAGSTGTATTASHSDHTHAGVGSAVAGTGISVSSATGAVTFTNTGVTSIVAGTGITISGATGAVTVNATATSFPGFGGPPPAIASASATGTATTASHSDHTHAQDLSVVYAPSLAAGQATGVFQQTYSAPNATPSVLNVATGRIPFGASGILTTLSDFTMVSGVLTVPATIQGDLGGADTLNLRDSSAATTVLSLNGGVVTVTGHVEPSASATYTLGTPSLAWSTGTINTVQGSTAAAQLVLQNAAAANSTITIGAASILAASAGSVLISTTGAHDLSLQGTQNIVLTASNQLQVTSGQMVFTGGTGLDMNGLNAKMSGNTMVGPVTAAFNSNGPFAYLTTTTANPTGTPSAPFGGGGCAVVYDLTNHRLDLYDSAIVGWFGIPIAFPSSTGSGVVSITNAPSGVTSLTPKWETYKDSAGTSSWRFFLQ